MWGGAGNPERPLHFNPGERRTNRIKSEVERVGEEGALASGLSTALSGCCQGGEEGWSRNALVPPLAGRSSSSLRLLVSRLFLRPAYAPEGGSSIKSGGMNIEPECDSVQDGAERRSIDSTSNY